MHSILSHPLLERDLTILRDKETPSAMFRDSLDRIAVHLCIAASAGLTLEDYSIQTPLQETKGYRLKDEVILVPILRAGLTLLHSFSRLIPSATIGYIGLKRDENSFEARQYYCNIPPISAKSVVIILDPMLATAGSMCTAVTDLKGLGAERIRAACVIAAPEGIARLEEEHPDVILSCAALDTRLNENGYIIPGLGDAGDRAHGTPS